MIGFILIYLICFDYKKMNPDQLDCAILLQNLYIYIYIYS